MEKKTEQVFHTKDFKNVKIQSNNIENQTYHLKHTQNLNTNLKTQMM